MTQDIANVYDDATKLMMDEFGGIHVVGFGENSLVAVAARDKVIPWKWAHPKLVDQIIYRFNKELEPEAGWMREHAILEAANALKSEYQITSFIVDGVEVFGSDAGSPAACYQTILELIGTSPIPIPTNADLLAEAMKLPEVVAFVEALGALKHAVCGETGFANCVRIDSGKAYPWPALDAAEHMADAALATFTAAKATT